MGSWKTFLAFGCVHVPIHDTDGVAWLVEQVRERQPDVLVCLGDMLDAEAVSRHDKASPRRLIDEYEAADGLCAQLNEAAPKAKKVWLAGNHEQRIQRPEHAMLSDVLDYRKHLRATRRWKHIDYVQDDDHTFNLGQVTFMHGFAVGTASCKYESYDYGVENGLTVYAHTHRPHPVHRISLGTRKLRCHHVNTGTFISREAVKGPGGYMQAQRTKDWGQGIVVGAACTKRRMDPHYRWRAELIVNKMMDGSAPEPAFEDRHGVYSPN